MVNLPKHVVTNVDSRKLLPKYIEPFRVSQWQCVRILLFYIGRLRPYHHHEVSYSGEYNRHAQEPLRDSFGPEPVS